MTNTLVTIANPRSPIAEAYRTLRTNLEFSSLDKSLRSLLVTSASSEEGKSTTLANLAVTIGQSGKRVILVDADLRRPTLHQIFGLKNSAGLTDMVRDESITGEPALARRVGAKPESASQRASCLPTRLKFLARSG